MHVSKWEKWQHIRCMGHGLAWKYSDAVYEESPWSCLNRRWSFIWVNSDVFSYLLSAKWSYYHRLPTHATDFWGQSQSRRRDNMFDCCDTLLWLSISGPGYWIWMLCHMRLSILCQAIEFGYCDTCVFLNYAKLLSLVVVTHAPFYSGPGYWSFLLGKVTGSSYFYACHLLSWVKLLMDRCNQNLFVRYMLHQACGRDVFSVINWMLLGWIIQD